MKPIFLASALVAVAAFAPARAGELTPQYDKCVQSVSANQQYAACGQAEIDRQDKRLNDQWAKIAKCVSDPNEKDEKQKLLDEQRLWLKLRDASCGFYNATDANGALLYGREGQVLSYPACVAKVVSRRVTYLQEIEKDVCGE